ncbi:hypothetical protein PR048_020763 [Dryococelus australis]|uniref:HTH CENPB-type domain-containing protein n=1 Tax=Dryococelus australis TaxID=614101 RepID=A0ABQ9GWB6_9NEOP|nr:hypothetical protein PR048_020763 [Dryococelus australis]
MEQKLKVIERVKKRKSVKVISNKFGVRVTKVKDWHQNKNTIQDFLTQIESDKVLSTHCTLKKPTNEIVDNALWFVQEHRKGTPISGPSLKEKAVILHSKLENRGEFSASNG